MNTSCCNDKCAGTPNECESAGKTPLASAEQNIEMDMQRERHTGRPRTTQRDTVHSRDGEESEMNQAVSRSKNPNRVAGKRDVRSRVDAYSRVERAKTTVPRKYGNVGRLRFQLVIRAVSNFSAPIYSFAFKFYKHLVCSTTILKICCKKRYIKMRSYD